MAYDNTMNSRLIDRIAAVVLGGISLAGGRSRDVELPHRRLDNCIEIRHPPMKLSRSVLLEIV